MSAKPNRQGRNGEPKKSNGHGHGGHGGHSGDRRNSSGASGPNGGSGRQSAWNSTNSTVVGGQGSGSGPGPGSTSGSGSGSGSGSSNRRHSHTRSGSTSPAVATDDASIKHMNDRFNYLLVKSLGAQTVVTVSSGAQYRGILSAASADEDLSVVLKYVTKVSSAPGEEHTDSANKDEKHDKLLIPAKDLAELLIEKPNLAPDRLPDTANGTSTAPNSANSARTGFKTDTDISGPTRSFVERERELQPWQPSDDPALNTSLEEFGDSASLKKDKWDQFAANERFGVQSTYDEHFYTTAINKEVPNYKAIEKRAEKLAAEIQGAGHGGNVHIAEERGITIDDSGLDEEDKYSGVDRKPGPTENRYTPPQFRPPSGSPSASGVPYDPAIISSQLAAPDGKVTELPPQGPQGPQADSGKKSSPQKLATGPSKFPSKTGIEKELAGNFRQFVTGEMERFQQKKQFQQKKEKSDRLNAFKKFSEEYKIPAPVPADLLPILAKGKDKQEEIRQRTASGSVSPELKHSSMPRPGGEKVEKTEKDEKADNEKSEKSDKGEQGKKTSEKAPAAAEKPKPKFNFNVPEFRPNPSAHSFTPSQSTASLAAASKSPSRSPVLPTKSIASPLNSPQPPPQATQAKAASVAVSTPPPPVPAPATGGSTPSGTPAGTPAGPVTPGSTSRTPTPSMFFGQNKEVKAKSRAGKFNPFLRAKRDYDDQLATAKAQGTEPPTYVIERAWSQGPTWPPGGSDRSYLSLFPSPEAVAQRQFMMSGGGMPSPRGNVAFPVGGMVPMMQPTGFEDPNFRGSMMGSPLPGQIIPGFIPYGAAAAAAAAAAGSPQYGMAAGAGAPGQYYGRGAPQPFMSSPQMMNQGGFPVAYAPPYQSSPRGPNAMVMPQGHQRQPVYNQYGGNSGPRHNNRRESTGGRNHSRQSSPKRS